MDQIPKHIKRALRQLADQAYEAELGRELTSLETEFGRWHRGEVSPFDVAQAIHRFHQGPARELYVSYTIQHPQVAVAHAIRTGVLDRRHIAPDVLAELVGVRGPQGGG